VRRIFGYAWASPNTVIGLALGVLALLLGARPQARQGALEFSGGALGALVSAPWLAATLDCARGHEQVHVRQYEQWGPLFLPAYVASSLWALACGRRCYRDNWFERQAFERS
jgi:hypothetical protein